MQTMNTHNIDFFSLLREPSINPKILEVLNFFKITKPIRVKRNENEISIDAPGGEIGFCFSNTEELREASLETYPEGTLFLSTVFIYSKNATNLQLLLPNNVLISDDRASVYAKMSTPPIRTNSLSNSATWKIGNNELLIEFSKKNDTSDLICIMIPFR